jgi:hypothetical protein
MHDPLTVAFEIRRPWPETADWRTKQAARTGVRWQFDSPFWVLAGRGLYFPSLVTIWHRDPSGYNHTTCIRRGWKLHVHHWRFQVRPLQDLRRWLLTRCAWCAGRSVKGDRVNHSHSWDGPRARWWQGERGLFHADCSSIKRAHSTCTCTRPVLENDTYGHCARCERFRPFGITDVGLERARDLQTIPHGGRRDDAEEIPA